MWFGVVSLFPEMFAALNCGITDRAQQANLIELAFWNPREFSKNKHHTVDDRPYGGGPGMVMMVEPLTAALTAARQAAPASPTVVLLSPQGKRVTQANAQSLYEKKNLILIAGRYEGIDERFIQSEVDEEWSVGDYVLSGGELAAMVLIDVLTRLIPGALGHEDSVSLDSLSSGLLKHPQYTRPELFNSCNVPEVLTSGNHQAIERWRLKESLGKTWLKRPDLLIQKQLTRIELVLLCEFVQELKQKSDL